MGRVQPLDGHHKYDKISDLGEGAFGFVQLARNKHTGEHVAIKFLPRGPDVPPPPPQASTNSLGPLPMKSQVFAWRRRRTERWCTITSSLQIRSTVIAGVALTHSA